MRRTVHRGFRPVHTTTGSWIVIGLISILTLGCNHSGKHRGARTAARPLVRGLDGSVGRIESVRTDLHLVVLDYSLSTLPQHGELLSVWRDGIEVGQVRVTGPSRPGTGKIGGEFLSGDVRTGDLVRPKQP